jgi:hypothetical protein
MIVQIPTENFVGKYKVCGNVYTLTSATQVGLSNILLIYSKMMVCT